MTRLTVIGGWSIGVSAEIAAGPITGVRIAGYVRLSRTVAIALWICFARLPGLDTMRPGSVRARF
jgi:hypothetical protein